MIDVRLPCSVLARRYLKRKQDLFLTDMKSCVGKILHFQSYTKQQHKQVCYILNIKIISHIPIHIFCKYTELNNTITTIVKLLIPV